LTEHAVAPPALRPFAGIEAAERAVSAWCASSDAPAQALAMLGNALVRQGHYVDALEAYRSAADGDPSDALAHLACAEIAYVLHDEETSEAYRARALALQRVYPDPRAAGGRTPVLLLLRDAPYAVNTPLEVLLDRSRVAIHKYYVEGEAECELPPFDVAFCAFGHAEAARHAVERTAAFAVDAAPIFNDPLRLHDIARDALAATLRGIEGVAVAASRVVPRDRAGQIALPALLRPLDTHAGDGFTSVPAADDLRQHLERYPASAYFASDFVDYRSADGLFRKFRVIFVDGIAYPYHLAVAPSWMVHYQNAPMREQPALRDEERAFLEDPARVVPAWGQVMPRIARAIGLEYFGVDATVLPDGRVFVFEADAAMLVHDEEAHDVFAYKRPHVARIREALHAAITRRSPRRTP
jgi:tetratricopeptide (TPR) repeat protein